MSETITARKAAAALQESITDTEWDIAREALYTTFGAEFTMCTPGQRCAVITDYALATFADRADYARNIGRGNLARYADAVSTWVFPS